MILMVKKLLEHFIAKDRSTRISNRKSNVKDMIIHLIAGLIKKT